MAGAKVCRQPVGCRKIYLCTHRNHSGITRALRIKRPRAEAIYAHHQPDSRPTPCSAATRTMMKDRGLEDLKAQNGWQQPCMPPSILYLSGIPPHAHDEVWGFHRPIRTHPCTSKRFSLLASLLALAFHANPSRAYDEGRGCLAGNRSFVEMQTPNLVFQHRKRADRRQRSADSQELAQLPADCRRRATGFRGLPAVLILHGSSGVDSAVTSTEGPQQAGFFLEDRHVGGPRGRRGGITACPARPHLRGRLHRPALPERRTDIDPTGPACSAS